MTRLSVSRPESKSPYHAPSGLGLEDSEGTASDHGQYTECSYGLGHGHYAKHQDDVSDGPTEYCENTGYQPHCSTLGINVALECHGMFRKHSDMNGCS